MKIYAIIPARGGSKGVPGKNIRPLAGKPLIAWTIEAAKKLPEISRVIVNTDDEDIGRIATEWGAELFKRPKELAADLTEDLPVFVHHLETLAAQNELPDLVVDLRATAPLRDERTIREGLKIIRDLGPERADSIRAVSRASKHPYKMWRLADNYLEPLLDQTLTGLSEPYNAPRQILPHFYQNNGCFNAFWPQTVLGKRSMTGERIAGFVMPDDESINIDTEIDFLLAEHLMQRKQL